LGYDAAMSSSEERRRRRSIRLPGYNYSEQGSYFITICTAGRQCILGNVEDGVAVLSAFGEIARQEWLRSATLRREVILDAFVVMPNHVHGIVTLTEQAPGAGSDVGAHGNAPGRAPIRQSRSIATFVGGFKGSVVRRINRLRGTSGVAVWQRNYHEHIIRDEEDLQRIRQYIIDNPLGWERDQYYSDA
jgi:REP element-mobilizing transposase RayT